MMEKGCTEDAGKNQDRWHCAASAARCAEKCFETWRGG